MDDNAKDFVAGVAAGVALVAVGHPFDTVKVKLQAQQGCASSMQYRGAMQCTADILRTEGIRGLYKGASSSLLGVTLESSILFGTYSSIKRALHGNDNSSPPSFGTTVVAAGVAGTAVSLVLCPTELIKCRLQVQGASSPSSTGLQSTLPHVAQFAAGVPNSASVPPASPGFAASSGGAYRLNSVHSTLQTATGTAFSRGDFSRQGGARGVAEVPAVASSSAAQTGMRLNSSATSPSLRQFSQAFPGAEAAPRIPVQAPATHTCVGKLPLSTVAGMAQAPVWYTGPWDCVVKTVRQEGPQALFKGLGATALREGLGNIFFFTTYEYSKRHLTTSLQPWTQGRWLWEQGNMERLSGDVSRDRATERGAGMAQPIRNLEQRLVWRETVAEAVTGVMSGGLAGIVFWCAVLPFDVVKTQIQTGVLLPGQTSSAGVVSRLQHLYSHSGPRGLYAGLGPTLWRAFPANAAAVLAWELTARMLGVRNLGEDEILAT